MELTFTPSKIRVREEVTTVCESTEICGSNTTIESLEKLKT